MLKKIICLIVLFSSLPVFAEFTNYPRTQLSGNNLSALEKYAFNKTYRRDNSLNRLERLENLAFGATQYGDLDTRYNNLEQAILSRPQYKRKNTLLNNLANYFIGQSTGFTPNLIPYNGYENLGGFSSNPYLFTDNFNNNFRRNNFENYSNGPWGGGWRNNIENYGSGSSIRILD